MREKVFVVSHPKARYPITIKGKTLEEALEKEGLDPAIWKEISSSVEEEEQPVGEDTRAAGPEDN